MLPSSRVRRSAGGRPVRGRSAALRHPLLLAAATGFMLVGVNCGTPHAGRVTYRLAWDETRVDRSDDGWSVTNDLGYTVQVERGWMVSYGLSLVACDGDTVTAGSELGVGTAWAGHSGPVDLSAITTSRVESLTELREIEVGGARIPSTRYCRAHYLVARADDGTADMPPEADLERVSLRVEGRWVAPDGRVGELEVQTSAANGTLRELERAGGIVDTSSGDTRVTWRRDVGALFDGVDFARMSQRDTDRQLLRNLIDSARLEIERAPTLSAPGAPASPATAKGHIAFVARVGNQELACGASVRTGAGTVVLRDLRLFVSDFRIVDSSGRERRVLLSENGPAQSGSVALLDFENGSGECRDGTVALSRSIAAELPAGPYAELRFTVGVPFEDNHANPALANAPLNLGSMSWGWQGGYKFVRLEAGLDGEELLLHLGSTGCRGRIGAIRDCARSNRADVSLADFDPATDRVLLDLAPLLTAGRCQSAPDDPACIAPLAALGIDAATGLSKGQQTIFRRD